MGDVNQMKKKLCEMEKKINDIWEDPYECRKL